MTNKRPKGFMLYADKMDMLLQLENEQIGAVVRSSILLFLRGEFTDTKLDQVERICFSALKNDIERGYAKYQEVCERNRENRNKHLDN